MKHTYLFEPAVWSVAGTFWRADGEALEAVGRTQIAHRPECWLLSGTLKVLSSPPVEFVHAYWIEPQPRQHLHETGEHVAGGYAGPRLGRFHDEARRAICLVLGLHRLEC